jgi:hypothetical protein
MKRNAGLLAAFGVAVAAFFGLSTIPSRITSATQTGAQKKEAPLPQPSTPLVSPCGEIQKRIRHFLSPKEADVAPANCYEKPRNVEVSTSEDEKGTSELRFLIATLPDPVHTHLSLQFDRLADTIQRAAQDQDYNFDSSWLPWTEQSRLYGGLNDQDKADERKSFRERQPGLLVFRSSLARCSPEESSQDVQESCRKLAYQDGLLVFIVGENPTGGIDVEQFENAIAWIQALRPQGTGRSLRILGPVFSGSFPSLAQALGGTNTAQYIAMNNSSLAKKDLATPTVVVFSGSATSRQGITWFTSYLTEQKDLTYPFLGRFVTFQESDDVVINRYCRMLDHEGYDIGRLAIISEDESAYGSISEGGLDECIHAGNHRPLNLNYPRDVASLRTAYAKQSPASSGQSVQQLARGLPQDLSESGGGERDTIRTYGEKTPLSQESTLFEVVNLLEAHQIQFILLRSSNVLDQLFLTYFFGRTYPEARVVILNSDLMFGRSTEVQGFRGTMTLSTYPLLTWQQEWTFPLVTPESHRNRQVFADANSHGLYLAGRLLIQLADSALREDSIPAQNYGPPSWLVKDQPTRPPTWLSVLGAGRIWPVAVIDDEDGLPRSILPAVNTGAPRHDGILPSVPMSTWVCFSIVLLWCGLHLWCSWFVSLTATPRCRAYFASSTAVPHDFLIFFGCLLFPLLAVAAYSLTSTPAQQHSPFREYKWMLSFYVLLVVISLLALIGNYIRTKNTRASPYLWVRVALRGVLFVALTASLWVIFYVTMTGRLDRYNDVFTVWRSVNLFSGVSPLTPLLLLIVGAYGWFWYTLAGLALFNRDSPGLPRCTDLDERLGMFSWEDAGDPIERAAKPFDGLYRTVLVVVSLSLVAMLLTHRNYFMVRSLGPWTYGLVYSIWICLCIALIVAETFQVFRIWSRLQKLLTNLDRLPLRRTLHALRGFSWGTVWKMSGSVLQQRYKLLSRQIESYGHLRNTLEHASKYSSSKEELESPPPLGADYMEQLAACDNAQKSFIDWYSWGYKCSGVTDLEPVGYYQKQLTKMAGAVCRTILIPQWRKEGQSLIQDLSEPASEIRDRRELSFPPIPDFQRQAEEFFALPYLGFIQNILGRVRTIAIGLFWLFTTATFSVISYPFDPRPVLGGVFLGLFVVVGAVIYCVYASMHRDTTLSHITNTNPGELGWAFWAKLTAVGIGPLLAVLTALFPSLAGFVTSWLQPSVEAMK